MMTSHNSGRMLAPGNTRKRKNGEADKPPSKPTPSNRLLAGYLAHEFLTKGTLFGQKFDPNSGRAEPNEVGKRREQESYGEVASIVKTDGTHIKGIVNPTQLSQWIRM